MRDHTPDRKDHSRTVASRPAHDTSTPDVETAGAAYRKRFSGSVGRFFLQAQLDAVERVIRRGELDRPRVLDVGGGHGQLTEFLLDRHCDVWVQGSALSCRRQIEPLIDRYGERLHFIASSLWSLPFADRTFDMVMAVRVMSHVERWEALLSEMARVTKRSLLIDFASLLSGNILTPLLFHVKRRMEGNTRPYFCYTTTRLSRHLRNLGFDGIATSKQLFMPMGIHRKVNSRAFSVTVEACCRAVGLTRLLGSPVILLADKKAE